MSASCVLGRVDMTKCAMTVTKPMMRLITITTICAVECDSKPKE